MLSAFVWNWNLKAWGGVGAGDRLNESDWNQGRAASVPFCPVATARAYWSTDLKGLFANIYIGGGGGGCGRYFQVPNTQYQHHLILEHIWGQFWFGFIILKQVDSNLTLSNVTIWGFGDLMSGVFPLEESTPYPLSCWSASYIAIKLRIQGHI